MVVDLETAKFLKLHGYKKPCKYFYQDKDLPYSPSGLKWCKTGTLNHNKYDDFIYSAPSLDDAHIFLTKHNIRYERNEI